MVLLLGEDRGWELAQASAVMSLSDLPSEIVVEIMVRLPITAILRCRCVCKTLNSLLSDPSSANLYLYLHRQTQSSYINILLDHCNTQYHLMEYDSTLPSNNTPTGIMNIKFIGDAPRLKTSRLSAVIVGFCNGFLCLRDCFSRDVGQRYSLDRLYITNPILGEFLILPKHRQVISAATAAVREVFGFGFSHAQSRYKVLAITGPPPSSDNSIWKAEVRVLTLGEDSWRIVPNDVPFTRCLSIQVNATLNGGALVHWINVVDGYSSETGPLDDFIYSFNFDEERVKSIPNPPVSIGFKTHLTRLRVLRDRLCLFLFDITTTKGHVYVDMWSMKEYGVKESWTKLRITATSFPSGLQGKYSLIPLVLLPTTRDWEEEGDILMMCGGTLVYCDSKTGVLTRFRLPDSVFDRYYLASVFTPSFLSLKHVVMGGLKIHNVHPRGTPYTNEQPSQ